MSLFEFTELSFLVPYSYDHKPTVIYKYINMTSLLKINLKKKL